MSQLTDRAVRQLAIALGNQAGREVLAILNSTPVEAQSYVIGDGVTDDTTGFQTMLTSVPAGSTIHIPYWMNIKLTGQVTWANKALYLDFEDGARVTPSGTAALTGAGLILGTTVDNSIIRGLTVVGQETTTTVGNPTTSDLVSPAIKIVTSSNVVVENCRISGKSCGIRIERCTDCIVRNNVLTGMLLNFLSGGITPTAYLSAVFIESSTRTQVLYNKIDNWGTAVLGGASSTTHFPHSLIAFNNMTDSYSDAIGLSDSGSDNDAGFGAVIAYNRIRYVHGSGGIKCFGAQVLIAGNRVEYCPWGINLMGGQTAATGDYGQQAIGNVVTNCDGNGIYFRRNLNASPDLAVYHCTAANNLVYQCGGPSNGSIRIGLGVGEESVSDGDQHMVVDNQIIGHKVAYSGTVNTAGTAVTWVSGDKFRTNGNQAFASPGPAAWAGTITINSVAYTISTVNSPTSITLTATAGTQTAVAYTVALLSAQTAYGINVPGTATGTRKQIVLRGNSIELNVSAGVVSNPAGIIAFTCNTSLIADNTIKGDGTYGMYLYGITGSTIARNICNGMTQAIFFDGSAASSTGNIISDNAGNTITLFASGGVNTGNVITGNAVTAIVLSAVTTSYNTGNILSNNAATSITTNTGTDTTLQAYQNRYSNNIPASVDYVSASGAPSTNSYYIGQMYLRTDTSQWYRSKATGTGASDWVALN